MMPVSLVGFWGGLFSWLADGHLILGAHMAEKETVGVKERQREHVQALASFPMSLPAKTLIPS